MPSSSFDVIRTLHLVSVALALGAIAAVSLLRTHLEGAGDSRWVQAGLGYVARVEGWLLVPGSLGVLVFGLLMVEGPWARFSFTADGAGWLHIGTTLWLLLAGAVGAMIWARRGLQERAEAGATGGKQVAGLWRWWTSGAMVASLVLVGGVATMAMKLGV